MITIVRHDDVCPSYFYVDDDNDVSNTPKCSVNSKILNLTTKSVWILCHKTSNTLCWRKFGTNQEVQCSWMTN